MFVKLMYNEDAYEMMYQCSNYDLSVLGNTDGPDKLLFTFYGVPNTPTGTATVEIDKKASNAVYVMNENGKTIDHYEWA